ncbi:hypothetical protein [Heyndrickxia acidiproducens]|uniref:hypothetical protein n=1 Tax=Heyndrickxia acidiproducens TaxID=1121084 RepID=UPI0003798D98|nr:hypothetical protein [Heyndrickxia acidiproducens]
MIYGETSQVYSVNFEDGENADTLKMKLLEVIEKNGLKIGTDISGNSLSPFASTSSLGRFIPALLTRISTAPERPL